MTKNGFFRTNKIGFKLKGWKLKINDTKHHTYFILLTCHQCMSNLKMKIERMSPKVWLTTSHHLGVWKTILQFGEESGILLMLGCRFPSKFSNPRTLRSAPKQNGITLAGCDPRNGQNSNWSNDDDWHGNEEEVVWWRFWEQWTTNSDSAPQETPLNICRMAIDHGEVNLTMPQSLSRESTGSLSLLVVRARFEPLRRSLFAPDWDCLRSVAAAALKGNWRQSSGADRVRLCGHVKLRL